jgi:acyl-CoA dehydrogenase
MTYIPPLDDMIHTLRKLADCERLRALPPYAAFDFSDAGLREILEPAATLAAQSVAPSNRPGDQRGAKLVDGRVEVCDEVAQALRALLDGGWTGATLPAEVGGFGLPECVGTVAVEMWNSGNMALALNPVLTIGAALALLAHADPQQIETYVPKMASGVWAGTMNLTEPSAGSDLSRIRTQAVRDGDVYRLRGQKIFITWGDHELTENIVHLVLARTPDAPAGTRGISLFIVPKFLVNADGSPGARNDVRCVSIEHKLGLHSSPTCVMSYGENDGAIGYLVGEENHGLAYLFTMMNEARLKVGLQGLAIAEGAYQQALAFAHEREQGNDSEGRSVPIVAHADVQRMLLTQRALIQAMRSFAYVEAVVADIAHYTTDAEERARAQRRVDLMVPVIKGWLTELGMECANLGIQIHGGMGFIEETGAAQWLRDVRVAAIYEGTNGIQAADLLGRKLLRDRGHALREWLALMAATERDVRATHADLQTHATQFHTACEQLANAAEHLLRTAAGDMHAAQAGAFDFMMQCGYVHGAWQNLRLLALSRNDTTPAAVSRRVAALFYFARILPRAAQHAQALLGATAYWRDDAALRPG